MVSTTPLVDKHAAQEREQARLNAELEERDRRNRAIEEEKKRQEQVGGVVDNVLNCCKCHGPNIHNPTCWSYQAFDVMTEDFHSLQEEAAVKGRNLKKAFAAYQKQVNFQEHRRRDRFFLHFVVGRLDKAKTLLTWWVLFEYWLTWQKQETKDLQAEYTQEREDELEIIRDLTKELKRLQFIATQVSVVMCLSYRCSIIKSVHFIRVECNILALWKGRKTPGQFTRSNSLTHFQQIFWQFVPDKHLEAIEKRAKWNEELGKWQARFS